jgi:hypothetical protein
MFSFLYLAFRAVLARWFGVAVAKDLELLVSATSSRFSTPPGRAAAASGC